MNFHPRDIESSFDNSRLARDGIRARRSKTQPDVWRTIIAPLQATFQSLENDKISSSQNPAFTVRE